MVLPTIEGLLDEWRDGKYLEVADTLNRMLPKHTAEFCRMLAKYEGVAQLLILEQLME